MYAQNQIFRTLGMGRFGDLLLEVSRDPAMLIWLDNASATSRGSPNENFAREVMELFTMGTVNYTQQDVTEAARAFTGWTIDPTNNNRFVFDPYAHDDGAKTFLGQARVLPGRGHHRDPRGPPRDRGLRQRRSSRATFLGGGSVPRPRASAFRSSTVSTSGEHP